MPNSRPAGRFSWFSRLVHEREVEAEEGGFITACLLKLSISVAENDRQVSCGETLAKSRLAYEIRSLIGSDISRAFFYPLDTR